MKNVGAQSPTKSPNRSACAWTSGSVPPVKNQMAMEPATEAKPRKKQRPLSCLSCSFFMLLALLSVALPVNAEHSLVPHQRDRRVAAQGPGMPAGLVRCFQNALSMIALGSRKLRMQLHCQAEPALNLFHQTHQLPDGGVFDVIADLLGRVAQGSVVASGKAAQNRNSGLGPRFSIPFSRGFPSVETSSPPGD